MQVHGFVTRHKYSNNICMELFVFKFGRYLLTHNCARIFRFAKSLPNVFHTNEQQNFNKVGTFIYDKTKNCIKLLSAHKLAKSIFHDAGWFERYETGQLAIFLGSQHAPKGSSGVGTFLYGPKLKSGSGLHYCEFGIEAGAHGLVGVCAPGENLTSMIGKQKTSFGFHQDGDCYFHGQFLSLPQYSKMRTDRKSKRGVLIDMNSKIGMYVIDGVVQKSYRLKIKSDEIFFAVGDASTEACCLIALPFERMCDNVVKSGILVDSK